MRKTITRSYFLLVILLGFVSCGEDESEDVQLPTPWENPFLFGNTQVNGDDVLTTNVSSTETAITDEVSATLVPSSGGGIQRINFNIFIPRDNTDKLRNGFDGNDIGIIVGLTDGTEEEVPVELSFSGTENFNVTYSSFTVTGDRTFEHTFDRTNMAYIQYDFDMVYLDATTEEEVYREPRSIRINVCSPFCQTSTEGEPLYTPGNGVTDSEGNFYSTVIVGGKEWMAENLRSTKYNNGTNSLFEIADDETWERNVYAAAWCYANNDPTTKETQGLLYKWRAAARHSICPPGFRMPNNNDWEDLINFIGGDNNTNLNFSKHGDELRSQEGWTFNGTNRSGLNVKPAVQRNSNGNFFPAEVYTGFWSADEDVSTFDNFGASYIEVDIKQDIGTNIGKNGTGRIKGEGKSCRCVKGR